MERLSNGALTEGIRASLRRGMLLATVTIAAAAVDLAIHANIGAGNFRRAHADGGPALEGESDEPAGGARAPGWIAVYEPAAAGPGARRVALVEPRAAHAWGRSAPHPLVGDGAFRVRWSGILSIEEDVQELQFGALASGRVSLRFDGKEVLRGSGAAPDAWLEGVACGPAEAGEHAITLELDSVSGLEARIQLAWSSDRFGWEPVPAAAASHDAASEPAEVAAVRDVEAGHQIATELGCSRCHAPVGAEPDAPPGFSVAELGSRTSRGLLLAWLDEPPASDARARMPRLFSPTREGFLARWIVADDLLRGRARPPAEPFPQRSWREGKKTFVEVGCVACHVLPDAEDSGDWDGRNSLRRVTQRFSPHEVARLLEEPSGRLLSAGMPRFELSQDEALEIAAYLELYGLREQPAEPPAPTPDELDAFVRKLNARATTTAAGQGPDSAAPRSALEAAVRTIEAELRCGACHEGLPSAPGRASPVRRVDGSTGCLAPSHRPSFSLSAQAAERLQRYYAAAEAGWVASEAYARRALIERLQCYRCHARDAGGGSHLERVVQDVPHEMFPARLPYLRVPSLAGAGDRFRAEYLAEAITRGTQGVRPPWYTYRMPAYGAAGAAAAEALLDAAGCSVEMPPRTVPRAAPRSASKEPLDPTQLVAEGRRLAGHGGYGCVACHAWKQASDVQAEPGAAGPDLTLIASRIRREWFDRWLEGPRRFLPQTPMPAFFPRDRKRAMLDALGGDADLQVEALWSYLSQAVTAGPPPLRAPAILPPLAGALPRAAQIPLRLPGGPAVEALIVQLGSGDTLVYDVEKLGLLGWWEDARVLRHDAGWRTWSLEGNAVAVPFGPALPVSYDSPQPIEPEPNAKAFEARHRFAGYETIPRGVRIRSAVHTGSPLLELVEELRFEGEGERRALVRRLEWKAPKDTQGVFRAFYSRPAEADPARWGAVVDGKEAGREKSRGEGGRELVAVRVESAGARGSITLRFPRDALPARPQATPPSLPTASPSLPAPALLAPLPPDALGEAGKAAEAEPGYRAVRIVPVDEAAGIQPCAVSVRPTDGKIFVASMKMGGVHGVELIDGSSGAGGEVHARCTEFAGPFQEAYGMVHRGDDLFLLHRRNVTRIRDVDGDGRADRFDRVFTWPQGLVSSYDWAYGLVPGPDESFYLGLAPWANRTERGSGGALRLRADGSLEDVAFGFRNPFGWCAGPEGELFITDNQGEWVAANRLCHAAKGRHFGFPNPEQRHDDRPRGKTALWVPYGWARSINGLVMDSTGGKFGPFAGQIFLAELYSGGGIIRAQLERVNGEFQGACFPFWGKGLLGPLALTFDVEGRLVVASLTEPSWMGQPDRGALYRIEFTGPPPFEIARVHARPSGFRLAFTAPVEPESAAAPSAYRIFHHRYSYGPEYGSPELEKTPVKVIAARLVGPAEVELTTEPLVRERIYRIRASGVRRQAENAALVHAEAAYTLNEIPAE